MAKKPEPLLIEAMADALEKLERGEEVNFAHRFDQPGLKGCIVIQSMRLTWTPKPKRKRVRNEAK